MLIQLLRVLSEVQCKHLTHSTILVRLRGKKEKKRQHFIPTRWKIHKLYGNKVKANWAKSRQKKQALAASTNLSSDSNKSFSSCVELFLKGNNDALKVFFGFVDNVPCNLKNNGCNKYRLELIT